VSGARISRAAVDPKHLITTADGESSPTVAAELLAEIDETAPAQ
jgi:hypothetical protein